MISFSRYKTLEIAITDFCNLDCPLCSQGVPLQKNKGQISVDELQRMSSLIKPFEFKVIKISGGEPTLHPQFEEICKQLRKMFPAHNYVLATNGYNLLKYKDYFHVFDLIDLVHYPGKNDAVYKQLAGLNIPNIKAKSKRDYAEMEDVYKNNNLNKSHIFCLCAYSSIKKIVGNRIYPCCVIFGQSLRNNINIDSVSVVMDKNWCRNLKKISIESYCRHCFIDVTIRGFLQYQLLSLISKIKKVAQDFNKFFTLI